MRNKRGGGGMERKEGDGTAVVSVEKRTAETQAWQPHPMVHTAARSERTA